MNTYTSWPKATAVIAALTFAVAPLVAFAEDSVETSTGVSARAEVTTQNSERPTLKQRLGIDIGDRNPRKKGHGRNQAIFDAENEITKVRK